MGVYNHTGQVVTDLERSKRFYQEVLGFKLWFEAVPPEQAVAKLCSLKGPLGTKTCYLTLDGFVIELIQYSVPGVTAPYKPRTMTDPGLTHISVAVDDIWATAKKTVQYGGQILEQSDIGIGLLIRDPDGQLVELLHSSFRANLPPKP